MLRALGGLGSAAVGWLGVDQVTHSGPDLAGIALIITALSGMIASVGGLIIALRRKPTDATDAALLAIARRLTEGDHDET